MVLGDNRWFWWLMALSVFEVNYLMNNIKRLYGNYGCQWNNYQRPNDIYIHDYVHWDTPAQIIHNHLNSLCKLKKKNYHWHLVWTVVIASNISEKKKAWNEPEHQGRQLLGVLCAVWIISLCKTVFHTITNVFTVIKIINVLTV